MHPNTYLKGGFTAPKTCIIFNLLLICFFFASSALACSITAWSPGASGAVSVNNPAGGVPRVKGSCGLKVSGTGYVQDNNPEAEDQFIGRFYFLPQFTGTGTTSIFIAYSDEASTELFSIKFDGTNIIMDASAAGGGSTSIAANIDHWNLVEFAWISSGEGSIWINANANQDAPSGTFTSGTGTVESVRLGAPIGFGGLIGTAFFDDYEAHRSLPVGPLLPGDATLDGIIDSADLDAIVDEFLFDTYPGGVTDCDLDGEITSGDINCAVAKF